jgi:cytochrome P450
MRARGDGGEQEQEQAPHGAHGTLDPTERMERRAHIPLPPGPREPKIVQLVRWLRDPTTYLDLNARRFGDCFTLRMPGNPPLVVLSDPAAIRDVFTADPDEVPAGEANVLLRSALGENSLLLLDGARHRRERKLIMPPFHGERMRSYGRTMRDVTDQRIDSWPRGRAFPIHTEMQAITLEVILRTVFGLSEGGARLERLRSLLVKWTNLGATNLGLLMLMFIPADRAEQITGWGVDEPVKVGPLRLDLTRVLPWGPLAKTGREVDELLYAELTARRKAGIIGEDVLSMLLEARDEHGDAMTDVELRDELLTLLLAGHETSATTLAWTFHYILSNPRVHAALKEEIRGVTGADGRVDPDGAAKLELLEATIKESMRLTPIITNVARKLTRPMKLGGRTIPEGARVLPCMWLVHRRADLWPDPLRFDPSRFLGKKIDAYSFFPFGGGARRCIGMAFASYEMKIVLAEVIARTDLRAAGGKVKLARRGITLAPSDGVRVLQ